MTELVQRLRDWERIYPEDQDEPDHCLCLKAADRIEELEKRNASLEAKLTTCEKYRDAYAECDRIGTQTVRDLEAKLKEAAMNEVIILGQAQEAYEQVAELKAKLAKALTALGDVQRFVKELEPYADQGHTLVPALQKACDVYVELTGGKDE